MKKILLKGDYIMVKEITMDSTVLDLFMEGWENKDNDEIIVSTEKKKSKPSTIDTRKKAYTKSTARMKQLKDVCGYVPEPEDEAVVRGMLKKHQLPIDRMEHPCGSSIANKRRMDAFEAKAGDVDE